jgi:hypothetical protein
MTILDRHFAVRLARIPGESSGFAVMLRNRCAVQRIQREQERRVPVQDR